ncbi:MAG TPA: DUF6502 family protein [Burkholderiaceae bacterium]|nr:DUF6502 family protein [Burkholderiaceae bacterium]
MPARNHPATSAPPELVDALAAVLRPLAQLCVAFGLPFAEVTEQLKRACVDAARVGQADAARRVSRISTATGINRREVTRLLAAEPRPVAVRPRSRSVATEVFAHWTTAREFRDRRGAPRALPRQGPGASFETLARSVTTDVHPRSILEQLVRLGLAELDPKRDRVTLVRDAFVPRGDARRMFGFLGENVGDHLAGAVENVLGDGQRHFEQAVFADELSEESMQQVRTLVTAQWRLLMQAMVPELERLIERDRIGAKTADRRLRIGLYTYEAQTLPARASDKPAAVPRSRRRKEPTT